MRLLLVLGIAAVLAGCVRPDVTPAAAGTPQVPELTEPLSPQPTPAPNTFVTHMDDAGYEHPRLDAATQVTIVWLNEGQEVHSVVSDNGHFAGSGPVAPGSEFRYTFLTPGDYAYHCRYHPDSMAGIVVVR